jgi:GNAT superfamily N-acetyltransferase
VARSLEELEFRAAVPDDAPRIAALLIASFETYRSFAPPGWIPPPLERETDNVAAMLAKPGTWCLVAFEGVELAGHVGVLAMQDCRVPIDLPGGAHFWQLFARQDWWGTGLATRLHAAAVEAAAQRGQTALRLLTPCDHARARRFYEREGWTLFDEFEDAAFGMRIADYRFRTGATGDRGKLGRVQEGEHRDLMIAAIATEGEAHAALLAGDQDGARATYARAVEQYRKSWSLAPPKSYGRLVGMLKAAVLAGQAQSAAAEVRAEMEGDEDADGSPVASYVRAVAAVILEDDEAVPALAARMEPRGEAFERTAAALRALAARDADAYAEALTAIEADFAGRSDHLTGVAIADTAVMLELMAAERGMAVKPSSPLVPAI